MDNKKKKTRIYVAVAGTFVAAGSNVEHEHHRELDFYEKFFEASRRPVMRSIAWGHLPHGPEPESPDGPLRFPNASIATSTSTSTGTFTISPLWTRKLT